MTDLRSRSPARPALLRVLVLVLSLVGPACGNSTDSRPRGDRAAEPVRGGTATVAVDAEPAGFNNRTTKGNTTVVRNIMRRVWPSVWTVTPDFQNKLDTDFVVSAESIGRDPQTVVYRIHPNASWYDGTPISAADFIYNWEVGRPGATDVDGKPISSVAPGEDAIQEITGSADGKTVTVLLRQPVAEWKSLFSKPLVPAHVGKRVGWNAGFDNAEAVTSGGPFRIETYNAGRGLTLVRNERYWGRPANLDSVTFVFVRDSATTVSALRNGEVDVIFPRAQIDLLDQLRNVPDVTVHVGTGFEAEFLDLNLRNEFLANPTVRRALALALDRPAIVSRTAGQIDKKAKVMQNRLLAAGDPGYADTSGGRYDRRDVAEARRLLEGAGFVLGPDNYFAKDGKTLELRITAAAGDALRAAQGELIQSQVKDAGIKLVIDNAPSDNTARALSPRLQAGDFDVANLSQGMAVNPTTTSASFTTTGSVNISKYDNSTVNRLYQEARSELDDTRRAALLNQIDRQLWDDLPRIPLYQRPTIVAFRSSLVNVGINAVSGPLWNIDEWARRS